MAKYSASNTLGGTQQNLSTSFKTALSLFATTGTLARGYICEMNFGADGAPNATDCSISWDVSKMTADGTGTAVTPLSIDPGNTTAAVSTSKANYTVEPTVTAATTVWAWAGNQRMGFRWTALDQYSRLGFPATANSGLVIRAKSTNFASTVVAQAFFDE
jgi:hypothetical protein